MEHKLKCWPEFFAPLLTGEKTFELRNDDRDFKIGDTLHLREWSPVTKQYSGREVVRRVIYKLDYQPGAGCAADFGLKAGYAILAIEPVQ